MNKELPEERRIAPFLTEMRKILLEKLSGKDNPFVVIHGGYGHKNTGDDTLLLVAKEEIQKIFPNARLLVMCFDPALVMESYGDFLQGVELVSFKSRKALKALLKCDAYILAAGGLHNTYWDSYLRDLVEPRGKYCYITTGIVNIRKKPTIVFGVGFHRKPDFIARWLMKLALRRVSLLGVRDNFTGEVLSQLNINNYWLIHDPALIYKTKTDMDLEVFKKNNKIGEHYIMLSFRYVKDEEQSHRAVDQMVDYVGYISRDYPEYTIVMVPFSLNPAFYPLENDEAVFEEIKKRAGDKHGASNIAIIHGYQTSDQVKNIAKNADMLILARHHALVLTFEYKIPTIVLSYNVKCMHFALLGGYEYILEYNHMTLKALTSCTKKILETGKRDHE